MDITPSTAKPPEENSGSVNPLDPSWENWRNEQIQTISNILSTVFKVEDEVRQMHAPSRLLRNPAKQSGGGEVEICEKLNAIRKQISEYEHVLQLSLKRIDHALQEIQPHEIQPEKPAPPKPLTQFEKFKYWMKKNLHLTL